MSPSWNEKRKNIERPSKQFLAEHSHRDYIDGRHALTIQVGTGSTPMALVQHTFAEQRAKKYSLDLNIITNSEAILDVVKRYKRSDLFENTNGIMTGGSVSFNSALDAYVGHFAARAIANRTIYPDIVFMGAFGIGFDGGRIALSYKFDDELSTQESLATRPTDHRVILADHTKFGRHSPYQAAVTAEDLLRDTNRVTIVASRPVRPDAKFTGQVAQFLGMLTKLAASDNPEIDGKEFELVLLNASDGSPFETLSLQSVRIQQAARSSQADTPAVMPESVRVPKIIPAEQTEWFDSTGEGPFSFEEVYSWVAERPSGLTYHLASGQSSQYITFYEFIKNYNSTKKSMAFSYDSEREF